MTEPLTIEERLRLVEVGQEIHAQILTNIQAELIEADRLSHSVERLGDGASELGKALLQVDKQQAVLTRLGRDLEKVQAKAEKAATPEDVADQVEAGRKQGRWRRLAALGAIVTLGFSALFYVSNAAHDACDLRQEATRVDIAVLQAQMTGGPRDRLLEEGIRRYRATLTDPCDEQYLLHLP